ncbi:MAG: heterodisulfide reductase-related iron-sulfur binding cluster, partial [Candidatus Limnocylindria bacterium]
LTREELAQRAEIDLRLYVELEEGRLLPKYEELEQIRAHLGGIEPLELYATSLVNSISDERYWQDRADYKRFYQSMEEGARLLVAPDEMLWLDRQVRPDRTVDVALNLSCSTQFVPHLMLDAVAVLSALGVEFTAGASKMFCCGTYFRRMGKLHGTARLNAASVGRMVQWGARTAVHTCTQCVNTFTEISRRQAYETGEADGMQHIQLLRFLDERLTELGDNVPWRTEVSAKILSHGHSDFSWVHDQAKHDVAAVARHIPDVEFVGYLDQTFLDYICNSNLRAVGFAGEKRRGATEPAPENAPPKTREEVAARRRQLADMVAARGADTLSPQHQGCLQMWQPFASETVRVRHVISLLAEALGVAHPDRYQAASRLGDTDAIVEQTRPIWSQWGMSRDRAFETARGMFDPVYQTVDMCGCGKSAADRCGHDEVIPIDVLKGVTA